MDLSALRLDGARLTLSPTSDVDNDFSFPYREALRSKLNFHRPRPSIGHHFPPQPHLLLLLVLVASLRRTVLLDVDASVDALSAVLSHPNDKCHPAVIAYASRSLSQPEQKYSATRQQMLAIVRATRHFRPQPEDWDDHLDRVLLACLPSVHHTTGATPCRIMFRKELSGHGLSKHLRLYRQRSGRRMKLPVDALSAVLSHPNDKCHPAVIAYASRSLSQPEQKYSATRQQMLAIVWATRHFRPQPEDWDDHLDQVLLACLPSVHHTTGATPCRIMFRKELSGHGVSEQLCLSRQGSGRRMKLPYADLSNRKIQTCENYVLTLYTDNTYLPVMSCIHYKFKSSLDYKTVSFEGLSVTLTNLKRLILEKEGIRTADFDLKVSNAQTGKEYTEDGGPIMRHTSVVVARVPADSQRRLPKVWDRSTEGVVVSSSSSTDLVGFSSLLKTGKNMTEEERIKLMEKESTREYDPSKYCKKNVTLTGTPPPSYLCNRCGQTGHWIKFCPTLNVKRTTGIPKNELLETTPDDPQAMMTSIGTFAVPVLHKNAFLIGKKEKPFISEEDESHGKPAETSEKEPLPTELLCSLCDNILKDAVVIPCCGFSFCDQCIRKHLLGKQECPNCQEPAVAAASLIPNGQLRMAVLKYRREKDCQNKPAAVHIPMATAAMKRPQPLPNTSNAVGCKNVAKNSTGGTTTAVQDGGGSGAFASKRENLLSSKAVKPTVGGHGGGVEQKMNPLTKLTHMVPRCIASHSNNATAVNNNNTLTKLNQKNAGISPATTVTSGGGTLKSSAMSSMTAASPAATFLGVAGSNANNAAVVGGANGNNVGGGNGGTGAGGGGGGAVMTTPAAVLRAKYATNLFQRRQTVCVLSVASNANVVWQDVSA
ncbi:E3 ubiquitin-protein ligase RBBP6 [Trichinella patagoniensis]|uniref:E3 ubiquitin-protein ligase RBBP6 n=1 Tax=Trichinella patagoniensis TaxID=990121 RepID=A0A0V0ZTT6_9BILA|nr:E3 ubiquitin-protein ligase RBBP6 [Trichinella patagoniensis]